MSDCPKTEWLEYPSAIASRLQRTAPETYLISTLDLAAWIDRNYPIPRPRGELAPRDPTKENPDRKDLETVSGYEQILDPTNTERSRYRRARHRLRERPGLRAALT